MTDVSTKNDSMTTKVQEISLKLETLETQVHQLPKLLASTLQSEFAKLSKQGTLPLKRKRHFRSRKRTLKDRFSATTSETLRESPKTHKNYSSEPLKCIDDADTKPEDLTAQ